ncbi:MAG: hypothetical protein O9341_12410, partial [Paucibacter sp.]|nr:hypothetical protein [Roseateles sp.]
MSSAPRFDAERWWRDEEVPLLAVQALRERVRLFGRQQTQGSDAQDIACARFDEQGELLVGASGRTEFQRLYVDYLW